ncbi:MAG TPA: MaoC family dehydratase N-terminal domain-containing protein [Paracoccaceae bacterium]|nr:MaoC family dehydratase N-terminal domain-containing protein [Paracoccaceae bacterium]
MAETAAEGRWAQWVGRVEEREDGIAPVIASMLAATFSDAPSPAGAVAEGEALAPLRHWAAFHTDAPMQVLGRDGHPVRDEEGFLPPVPLDRRMWAGGRVTLHAPIRVGERLQRRSEILKVAEKSGGAGDMVFVTIGHRLEGEDGLKLEEEQDVVYIAMPTEWRAPKAIPAPEAPAFEHRLTMSEARLFRYSAATFNAHRIHYDLPYAEGVEKYPGLVVHGPLQATLLMDAATLWKGEAPRRFRYRGVHPMFHTHALRVIGVEEDGALSLCTAAPAGHQGMQATAEWD